MLANERLQVHVRREAFLGRKLELVFFVVGDNRTSVATNVEFQQVDERVAVEPTFRLSPDEAQVLMDELWNTGIRPSDGAGSAGAMNATQKHLDDMRVLVFGKDHSHIKPKV